MPTSVLILKKQWLNKILDEDKRLEIRSFRVKKIGHTIMLMASGTDHIVGSAKIEACIGPMSEEEWIAARPLHHCQSDVRPYAKTYGWKLCNVLRFETPIPHKRKRGAIIFSTYHSE